VLLKGKVEAGAPWAGFHTFRHTFASMAFERRVNPKRIQVWLGHHALSFTMDTYTHLIPDDEEPAISVSEELDHGRKNGNKMSTPQTGTDRKPAESEVSFVPELEQLGAGRSGSGQS
jgi:hypothetical protein